MASRKSASRRPRKSRKSGRALVREPGQAPYRIRKNMDMDPAKLAAVKEILGAATETEAVDRAFDEIIFEHRVSAGLERLAQAGGLPDVDPDA
jgi:hypothetical protein